MVPRLRWVTITQSPDTAAVTCVLNLDGDPVGIVKIEFLRVASLLDLRVRLQRLELDQHALRVEVIDREEDVINARRDAATNGIETHESDAATEIHAEGRDICAAS
jgi:hypothetical protein